MKIPCAECNGLAGRYNEENEWQDCDHCDDGNIDRCVSSATFPESWKKKNGYEQLLEIKADALRCQNYTRRLCQLRPGAAASYEQQLAGVLEKLNQEADALKL